MLCVATKLAFLTSGSENAAVSRGVHAVNIIYSMTSRIPQLMQQSHLESNEGMSLWQNFA